MWMKFIIHHRLGDMENEIIIYQPDETIKLDVRLENETVWLSQAQMCELFQKERSVKKST